MTVKLPKLSYLDDRPVFPEDRRHAEAFARGGIEEERKERETIKQENNAREERNRKAFKDMIAKAKEERKAAKEAEAKLKAEQAQENANPNLPEIDATEKVVEVQQLPEAVMEIEEAEVEECPPEIEQVDLDAEREKQKIEWLERVKE